jgi:hypothetical protein
MRNAAEVRNELYRQFADCVKQAFFALEKNDFKVKECCLGWLQYNSSKVTLDFLYERLSYEIYVVIHYRSTELKLSLDDVLALGNQKRQFRFATSQDTIRKSVQEVKAFFCSAQGSQLLDGDDKLFSNIYDTFQETIRENERTAKRNQIDKAARKAWSKADFIGVIREYDLLKGDLTPIQQKRLNIAKKRIRDATAIPEVPE